MVFGCLPGRSSALLFSSNSDSLHQAVFNVKHFFENFLPPPGCILFRARPFLTARGILSLLSFLCKHFFKEIYRNLCVYILFQSKEKSCFRKKKLISRSTRKLTLRVHCVDLLSGERGIWTLAPVSRPTPLAGAPLQPLEYFSSPDSSLNIWFVTSFLRTHYSLYR